MRRMQDVTVVGEDAAISFYLLHMSQGSAIANFKQLMPQL